MNLCDSCINCLIRKFTTPRPEDYTPLDDSEYDDLIFVYCIPLDMVVAGEHTSECNYYTTDQRGDTNAIRLSMWQQNLFDVYQRAR